MKRMMRSLITALSLLCGGAAMAQQEVRSTADCKLSEINQGIANASQAIKASPAYGHAAGHYGKAEKALAAAKRQLEAGCKAWVKGGEKTGKAAK